MTNIVIKQRINIACKEEEEEEEEEKEIVKPWTLFCSAEEDMQSLR